MVGGEVESHISRPIIVSPISGSVDAIASPIITATDFVGINASGASSAHAASQWQIADDVEFTSIIYDSDLDNINLTSIDLSIEGVELASGTTHYIRVMYVDNNTVSSSWSSGISVTIASGVPTNQQAKLIASDATDSALFGTAVAISADGSTIVGMSNIFDLQIPV